MSGAHELSRGHKQLRGLIEFALQHGCPLPLLDHWRATVLELLQTRQMLAGLPFALGPLEGHRLAIDVPALTTALGDLIRSGTLGASDYELASNAPLRHVA